jgi:hypothetical protein
VQGDWAANAAIVTRTIASFDAPWAERPFPPPGTCTARGTPSLTLVRPREAPRSIEALADSPVQRSNPGHISTTRVLQLAATPGESCRSRSVSPATTSLIAAQADRLDHFAKVRVAGSSPVARSGNILVGTSCWPMTNRRLFKGLFRPFSGHADCGHWSINPPTRLDGLIRGLKARRPKALIQDWE